jgi:hypothetical protein
MLPAASQRRDAATHESESEHDQAGIAEGRNGEGVIESRQRDPAARSQQNEDKE